MTHEEENFLREKKYTVREASEESGMSVSWWRQKCFQRKIVYLKIGRKVLIPESTLQEVMRNAVVIPTR